MKMTKEAKLRIEIFEMIHEKFMQEWRDDETLDILEKIQKEVLAGITR
jgi:hypothetical protein